MSPHEEILRDLRLLKRQLDIESMRKIRIDLYENIIIRMQHLSGEVHECSDYLDNLKIVLDDLKQSRGRVKRSQIRLLKEIRKDLSRHLKDHHDLIPRGQYLSRSTVIGIIAGLVFGFIALEYALVGSFFGAIIGIAIGSKLDSDARQKGIEI
ncbi:MAG TPA: hypothetical protein PKD08_03720 [Gudongella oleilytica]|jgi:hypothetical protein|nr:hypothetical protein [Gudongella oleilytica]